MSQRTDLVRHVTNLLFEITRTDKEPSEQDFTTAINQLTFLRNQIGESHGKQDEAVSDLSHTA